MPEVADPIVDLLNRLEPLFQGFDINGTNVRKTLGDKVPHKVTTDEPTGTRDQDRFILADQIRHIAHFEGPFVCIVFSFQLLPTGYETIFEGTTRFCPGFSFRVATGLRKVRNFVSGYSVIHGRSAQALPVKASMGNGLIGIRMEQHFYCFKKDS